MSLWNPWHGCTKCSPGCQNCYVYRRDAEFGKDASIVKKTASFNLPVKKDRRGNYKCELPVFLQLEQPQQHLLKHGEIS